MSQTFTFERRRIPRDWFDHKGSDGGSWVISVEPRERLAEDGSKLVSMGFPVLVITDFTSGGEVIARKIADLLTQSSAA
jgi:hypothetical protein